MIKAFASFLALTALVGCARPPYLPQDADPGSTGSFGQVSQIPTGTVTGRIIKTGTAVGIPGVQVTLMGAAGPGNRTATTDGAGVFTLTQVPAVKQKLSLYKQGYTLSTNGDVIIEVLAGSTVTAADIALSESQEVVTNALAGVFNNIKTPQHIAYDANHNALFVVDKTVPSFFGIFNLPTELWEIKRLDTNGGVQTSFGDNFKLWSDSKHIRNPEGIACDAGGNVYLCDTQAIGSEKPIKQYGFDGKQIINQLLTGAGTPFGLAALNKGGFAVVNQSGISIVGGIYGGKKFPLSSARAVAVDANDNLYVIDGAAQMGVIKKFDLKSNDTQPVAQFGTVGVGQDQFKNPTSIAIDGRNGDFYIVDSGNNRVVRYDSHNSFQSWIGGMGSGADAKRVQFNKPVGVAVDTNGFVYVTDSGNNRILKLNPSPIRQLGQNY